MNDIDKFFSQFIGQSQGQGRFLRLSVEDNLAGGSFIGRKDNQDYLKVSIDGLDLTSSSGVQSVTAGTGITIGGTATNPIITNSAPNQTVVLTAGSGISITGTYPNFTISATSGGGTVTSVSASISGALSVSGSPITGSGTLSFAWTGTTAQYVRGDGSLATFPSLTGYVPYTGATTDVDLGANDINAEGVKITGVNGNGHLTMRWQALDPTGSGNHTVFFANSVGNLKYKIDGGFYTTIVANGNTADRVYTLPNRDITFDNITTSTTTNGTGFLKGNGSVISFDNSTYLTANQTITLSGEATGSGSTSIAVTLTNSAVIGKVLTGYVSGAGTVAATDTILQAIQKLNGNIVAIGSPSLFSTIRTVVGNHTLDATDLATINTPKPLMILMSSGSTQTFTIPLDSTFDFPIGTQISISQISTFQLTFAVAVGVTLNSMGGWLKIAARYGGATILKTAANQWYLFGALTP